MFGLKRAGVVQLYQDSLPMPITHVNGGITYVGYCEKLGTGLDEPKWLIIRITEGGGISLPEYNNGNAKFDGVWDDRAAATTTYSR